MEGGKNNNIDIVVNGEELSITEEQLIMLKSFKNIQMGENKTSPEETQNSKRIVEEEINEKVNKKTEKVSVKPMTPASALQYHQRKKMAGAAAGAIEIKPMSPLLDSTYELIDWSDIGAITYPNMFRIFTPIENQGSFYHALLNALFKPYRSGTIDGLTVSQFEMVRRLRNDLAYTLTVKDAKKNTTNYQGLANGNIQNLSYNSQEYKLKTMQDNILKNLPGGNIYIEYISDQMNIDIYILDGNRRDVIFSGDNLSRLYKNRKSVVLLYIPGHYELVGIIDEEGRQITTFDPKDRFINVIRRRLSIMCMT